MFLNFHTHYITNIKSEILNLEVFNPNYKGFFSYGIHPKNIYEFKSDESILMHDKCLAVGETGLDKNLSIDFEDQIENFKAHVHLSEKYELPLIIHCVKSWNEILQLKKMMKPKQKWIYHGFRKGSILKEVLENDFTIGIGATVLFDSNLQGICKNIPIEKLLLETDDQTINPIEAIYLKVAEIYEIEVTKLEKIIEQNFKNIFKKYKKLL